MAYHRLLFQRGQKERLVALSSRLAVAGLVLGLAAITSVLMLVLDVLTSAGVAAGVAGSFFAATAVLWLVPARWRDAGGPTP